MSKTSKTYKLKEAGEPKLHTKVLSWFNYTALPFVAKAVVVSGFIYAVVDNLAKFNQLPANVQGAVSVVLSAIVLKVAVNKK